MIRDPSDGSVREVTAEEDRLLRKALAASSSQPAIDIPMAPDTGIRQPQRATEQERYERSREWLKNYHATKGTTHARGNISGEEHSADGDSGNQDARPPVE